MGSKTKCIRGVGFRRGFSYVKMSNQLFSFYLYARVGESTPYSGMSSHVEYFLWSFAVDLASMPCRIVAGSGVQYDVFVLIWLVPNFPSLMT